MHKTTFITIILVFIVVLLSSTSSYAQNTFTTTGDATINTSKPASYGGGYNALWMPNAGAIMPENSPAYAGIMLTSNVIRNATTNVWDFANSTVPAWKLFIGSGSSVDNLSITRSAPNTYFEQVLFRIDNSGNVAIGTADPKGHKLAVNGSVIATAITVKLYSGWSDYVFKKDYELPSLTDVKTYIDQNHHLPDIPSEAEVARDGLNLGEMNKLLVKKVEELTLYLIEMKAEIKELKTQKNNVKPK